MSCWLSLWPLNNVHTEEDGQSDSLVNKLCCLRQTLFPELLELSIFLPMAATLSPWLSLFIGQSMLTCASLHKQQES